MTTITIERELLEQALETLTCREDNGHWCSYCDDYVDRNGAVRAALREALALPAQPDQAFVCSLGCTTECLARQHGVPSECPSLPRQPVITPATAQAAEIARLRSESEERLQNCVALVAENERLRAALATTPAQPATEPEQLKTGECWPERIMKQWDAMRDLIATGDKTSLPRDWFESLAEMRLIEAPATAPAQPERKPMMDQTAHDMNLVAEKYAHKLALDLECVLADYSGTWYETAMKTLGEYRSAMNAIHERECPTFMGEPVEKKP